jgi:hypothetical protein
MRKHLANLGLVILFCAAGANLFVAFYLVLTIMVGGDLRWLTQLLEAM